jgi:hypothetical protein
MLNNEDLMHNFSVETWESAIWRTENEIKRLKIKYKL